MKPFMDKHFLLHSSTAQKLYHDYAASWPICDYHCHIDPRMLADNQCFSHITEIWLGGDHYKWRAMRLAGIPEQLITGTADPEEKFLAWAELVPWLVGNPLYHWTHLELQRYFEIEDPLGPATAAMVWKKTNDALSRPDFRPLALLEKQHTRWLCTTDDPADSLAAHQALHAQDLPLQVIPAYRPDRFFQPGQPVFRQALQQLSVRTGQEITCFDSLCQALIGQMDAFNTMGCRLADHGFERLPGRSARPELAAAVFEQVLNGKTLTADDLASYQAALLGRLAENYHRLGWTMQLHIGALRNISTRAFQAHGPDSGFDVITDEPIAKDLAFLLDSLEQASSLPRTLLYSLNAKDNLTLATIAGAFARNGETGWVSLGPAWWFHDQLDGMLLHLRQLCQVGVLKTFVGMTTDSRSLLSYTRHEYFRRLFCSQLAEWIEQGLYPADWALLEQLIAAVCYQNAANLLTSAVGLD